MFISFRSASKYLKKASKLLNNKSNSSWISWLRGYGKKSDKYLYIFEQITPGLQGKCIEASNELESIRLNIKESQRTLFSHLLLLKLSCCLYCSRSYLYEEILDETKKLKFGMEGEKKRVVAFQVFNRELVVADVATKSKSRQPSLEPQHPGAIVIPNDDDDDDDIDDSNFEGNQDKDVISIGKSRRHEYQPAVWVGQSTGKQLAVTVSPPSSPSSVGRIKRAKSINEDLYDLGAIRVSLAADEYNNFADKRVVGIDQLLEKIDDYKQKIIDRCEKDKRDQKQIKVKISELKSFLRPEILDKVSDGLLQCDSMHKFQDLLKSGAVTSAMEPLLSEGLQRDPDATKAAQQEWKKNDEIVVLTIAPLIEEALSMPTDTNDQVLAVMTHINSILILVNKQINYEEIAEFTKSVNDLFVNQKELEDHIEEISGVLKEMVKSGDDLRRMKSPKGKVRRSMSSLFSSSLATEGCEFGGTESSNSTYSSAKEQRKSSPGAFAPFQNKQRSNSYRL